MQQEVRLPRNGKEGLLFGAIIVTLTATLMASINVAINVPSYLSTGEVIIEILKVLPVFWVLAMIIEPLIVGRIAEKLVAKFTASTDSFNAKILFRIVFTVFGMSLIMTIFGELYSNGYSADFFTNFAHAWPRNLVIVFIAESLMIQPIARFAMVKLHAAQDQKSINL